MCDSYEEIIEQHTHLMEIKRQLTDITRWIEFVISTTSMTNSDLQLFVMMHKKLSHVIDLTKEKDQKK